MTTPIEAFGLQGIDLDDLDRRLPIYLIIVDQTTQQIVSVRLETTDGLAAMMALARGDPYTVSHSTQAPGESGANP